ncbi:hypothetical protein CEUSTIGMA_g10195.t1 [Chlamydomonas eustigma]|uniref:Uncharacterized protein n=1 Tax=Chlamydomonas eustigma TaxID=1157962 RepID=A0A250XIM5_9CHLO|nr:hypothetical protein CEUSTIGMA_g10195.t1 [Chlamydomonas eustigma]|eukprot:GAX82769.1 hypothetical protein CEUSTIGMA_g10195.t1 [Chlamydomonas eustigma]
MHLASGCTCKTSWMACGSERLALTRFRIGGVDEKAAVCFTVLGANTTAVGELTLRVPAVGLFLSPLIGLAPARSTWVVQIGGAVVAVVLGVVAVEQGLDTIVPRGLSTPPGKGAAVTKVLGIPETIGEWNRAFLPAPQGKGADVPFKETRLTLGERTICWELKAPVLAFEASETTLRQDVASDRPRRCISCFALAAVVNGSGGQGRKGSSTSMSCPFAKDRFPSDAKQFFSSCGSAMGICCVRGWESTTIGSVWRGGTCLLPHVLKSSLRSA